MKVNENWKYLVGVDEVGRGPIAGPVAVGAFVILNPIAMKAFRGVKESKQLTEEKREEWFATILEAQAEGDVHFCVTFQSEKIIDDRGLTFAIKKALECSLKNIKIKPSEALVLLDGGLKAPKKYKNQKTIIKGDEKEKVIALASICAKVLRDRYMDKVAKKHVAYGFDTNKGYGTDGHYEALRLYGLLPIHRRRFLKTFLQRQKLVS
jgi:ribonuclease HII